MRDLLEDFGDARDIATIEALIMEISDEQGGGGSKRQVGVAQFDS